MKKLVKILFAAAALFASACETETTDYSLPVDVSWTTYNSIDGVDIYFEDRMNVEPGDYLFIRDVSQSVITREWTIDDKSSFFTDSNDTTTTIEDKTISTSDAYILFEKSGVTTIKLRLTFPEKVATYNEDSIEAVYDEELGVWVFEKEWTVEIYGELKPGFSVNRTALDGTVSEELAVSGDEETSLDDLTTIYVSQGDILEFVYDENSEYKSTSQSWTVPGGTTDGSGSARYTFNTVGTYSGYYVTATRDAVDSSATSGKISQASVRKVVPIEVIVEYAAISPLLGNITQQWDSTIEVPFNKKLELASYTTDALAELAQAFELKIGDDVATITSAAVSSDDSTILVLTVESPLDNYGKSATLSYTPTTSNQFIYDGSITDSSQVTDPSEGFDDVSVSLYHIFDPYYFGFDGVSSLTATGNIVDGWWFNCCTTSLTNDGSYLDVRDIDGQSRALYFEMYNGDTSDKSKPLAFFSSSNGDTIAAGEYTLHWKIYVEEYVAVDSTSATSATVKVVTGGGTYTLGALEISDLDTGKWLEVTTTATVAANSMSTFQITFDKTLVTNFQQAKFYIDDLYLSKNSITVE
ncbi:MAG: hypothetical protein SNJ35_06790 [Rikenellaceae bacterium]